MRRIVFLLVVLAGAGALGWQVYARLQEDDGASTGGRGGAQPAPVEIGPVSHGPMALRRTFTGTLEAPAEFVVAPKISGRIVELTVDLADIVRRGQVVARLDNEEYVQAVAQAEADISVARANLAEAESAAEISARALERVKTLKDRGVASESALDTAKAEALARDAAVEVAKAQVKRAEAARETSRIRLGYTVIAAQWTGGDDERVVAERFVDEGDTVSANTALLSVVELDPITGVVHVAERDYARLSPGQPAELVTDAYVGERFPATIDRISPVFRQATRQARVELAVSNHDHRLKPGMFIRATVVLESFADTIHVPEDALTRRDDTDGVFLVDPEGAHVSWLPVTVGIRADGRAQILEPALAGDVVTLGHQLLDDGSAIVVPESGRPGEASPE